MPKQLTKSSEPSKRLVVGQIPSGFLKYIENSPESHLAREERVEKFNKPVLNLYQPRTHMHEANKGMRCVRMTICMQSKSRFISLKVKRVLRQRNKKSKAQHSGCILGE